MKKIISSHKISHQPHPNIILYHQNKVIKILSYCYINNPWSHVYKNISIHYNLYKKTNNNNSNR